MCSSACRGIIRRRTSSLTISEQSYELKAFKDLRQRNCFGAKQIKRRTCPVGAMQICRFGPFGAILLETYRPSAGPFGAGFPTCTQESHTQRALDLRQRNCVGAKEIKRRTCPVGTIQICRSGPFGARSCPFAACSGPFAACSGPFAIFLLFRWPPLTHETR